MRDRLLGSGVLGPDDLAVTELVFDELANEIVLEDFRKVVRRLAVGDLDALMQVMSRCEITLWKLIKPRVLKVPHGPCLPDRSTGETDHARLLAEDLRVLADLPLGGGALLLGYIGRQWELRDFATHVAR